MNKAGFVVGLIAFSIIFLVFSIITVLQFTIEEKVATEVLDNGDIAASSGGAAIRISSLEGMSNPDISISQSSNPDLNYDASITAYNFNAGSKASFDTLIEVRVPYNDGVIETGQSAEECVVAGYYNKTTGQLEPVLYDIDEENSQVVITTDHLSTYAAVAFPNLHTRYAQCGGFPQPSMLSNVLQAGARDAYDNVVNKLQGNAEISDLDAVEVGFATANLYYGIASNTATFFSTVVYTNEYIGKLNDGFAEAGKALIVAQLGIDIMKGDVKQLNTNLMKNLTGYGAGLINPLAGAACFTIDYSLEKMGKALQKEQQKYRDGYKAYYEEYEQNQRIEFKARMYQDVYDIYLNNADYGVDAAEPMKQAVRDLVYDYCSIIWIEDSIEQFDAANERGLTPALQKQITDNAYKELMETTMKTVFVEVRRKIIYDAEMDALRALEEQRKELSKFCTLNIEEIQNFDGGDYIYADCIVKIDVSPECKQDWILQLNDLGSVSDSFQVIDYINYGMPTTAHIYLSQAALAKGDAFETISFVFDTTKYSIDIKLGAAGEEFILQSSAVEAFVGETVAFRVIPASEDYMYVWGLSDSIGSQIEVQFDSPGMHTVKVDVYDTGGTQVAALSVDVFINVSEITLACSNGTPAVGEKITLQVFSDTVSIADAETEWDFGDGYTDAGYFDTYQYWYDAPGQYTVTVIAYRYTDSGDRIHVGSTQLTVNVSGDEPVLLPVPTPTTQPSGQMSNMYILEGRFIESNYYSEDDVLYFIFEFSENGTYECYRKENDSEPELTRQGTFTLYYGYSDSEVACVIMISNGSNHTVYSTEISGEEIISFDDGSYIKE